MKAIAPREVIETTGRMVMMFDCPHCGEVVEIDHDASSEIVDCDACEGRVKITEVR